MKWQSPNPPGVAEGAEQVGQHGARMPRTKLASRKLVLVTVDNTSFPPDRQGAFSQHSCRHLLWARPRCGCWTNSEQSTTDRQTDTNMLPSGDALSEWTFGKYGKEQAGK